jgi:hypothetical protein
LRSSSAQLTQLAAINAVPMTPAAIAVVIRLRLLFPHWRLKASRPMEQFIDTPSVLTI